MIWSPVLRQALRQKHQEAQQSCRPHNMPVLQAAQQRELEVGAASWAQRSWGLSQEQDLVCGSSWRGWEVVEA